MINKKNLWFLTLFSLVLVLSIYYVTMPDDLLEATTTNINDNINVSIEESDTISALKEEDDSKSPQTSDSSNVLIWICLSIISSIGLVLSIKRKV